MTNPWLKQNARRLTKARALLQPALVGAGPVWADLGCGDGIFTYLLYEYLPAGNTIYALDKSRRALRALAHNLADVAPEAEVRPIQADFSQPLDLPPLDGLLLANALHFIKDKKPPLLRLLQYLNPGGRLVIIEYNTDRGTWAVPYPLDEDSFTALAAAVGLREARIVARKPSTFLGEMYTGLGFMADCRRTQHSISPRSQEADDEHHHKPTHPSTRRSVPLAVFARGSVLA